MRYENSDFEHSENSDYSDARVCSVQLRNLQKNQCRIIKL